MPTRAVTIRHWLPIITFCPVNRLPDLVYVSVTFNDWALHELYRVRKMVRAELRGRTAFMEDLGQAVFDLFPNAAQVTIRLAFNRHAVTLTRSKQD